MAKFTTVDQNGVVSIVDIDTRIGIVFKEGNSLREKRIACVLPDHNDLKFSTTVEKNKRGGGGTDTARRETLPTEKEKSKEKEVVIHR